jgi:uncharacterized protein (DUF924 family)
MTAALDPRAAEVLDFWFGAPDAHGRLAPREAWFVKNPDFDATIRDRFGGLIDAALQGELSAWQHQPLSALALLIVLDQFTRNTRRDSSGMFAGDAMALALARRMIASGQDRSMQGVQRQFVYLPFEHSERLDDQRESLRLFKQLGQDHPELAGLLEWAVKHQVIVERFGRFPHRNTALGRASTTEELEFLKQPGSGF